VGAVFAELAAHGDSRIVLLRNERNLGFTATANRGMTRSRADVVLLNSDTIVTSGWLDALVRCARSDSAIATVTPFSNNAEICSYPRFCENNRWPHDADPQRVAATLRDAAVPSYPDLPTGVGFCMFVRRAAIDDIGTFDPAFGLGYGEENDFCLRAAAAGWRNVLADDAFVVHTGGQSFEGMKSELGHRNLALIRERHPHYEAMVERYIADDPLRPVRQTAQALSAAAEPEPGVLHVVHHHGGGTETHVRMLIDASREQWRHYLVVTIGDRWQVEEHRRDGSMVSFGFTRRPEERWRDFVAELLATFAVNLVHLHNISGCREGILEALAALDVPFGYTLHDLNFACPTITFLDAAGRYCGGVTDRSACAACLRAQPDFAEIDIGRWRDTHAALLERAAFVVAPSRWAASTLERYFPRRNVSVIPHGIAAAAVRASVVLAALMPSDDVPVVAILGAIGPDKGARRVERLVSLVRERRVALRFVVIGYLDVEPGPWQSDDGLLTVHGRYDARDLAALLGHYRARFVLFPSAGPETFSYTLSEAWRAGLPALVPPIGALAERVGATNGGWVMTDDEWADEARMLDRIVALAADAAERDRALAGKSVREIAQPSVAQMAAATLAQYDAAIAATPRVAGPRFSNARIRDALDYRPWTPPPVPREAAEVVVSPAAPPTSWAARVARRALVLRDTPMGRLLYRVVPTPLITALKARLDA
jgi:glycosyltransferase involved in cell wall biosynthesis